jgi:hypothetical protein
MKMLETYMAKSNYVYVKWALWSVSMEGKKLTSRAQFSCRVRHTTRIYTFVTFCKAGFVMDQYGWKSEHLDGVSWSPKYIAFI